MDDAQIEKLFEELASLKMEIKLTDHHRQHRWQESLFRNVSELVVCRENNSAAIYVCEQIGSDAFFVVPAHITEEDNEKNIIDDETGSMYQISYEWHIFLSSMSIAAFERGHIVELSDLSEESKFNEAWF